MGALAMEGYETLVRQSPEGLNLIAVMVEGVHCGACIQKIESTLIHDQDVVAARLNFTTRRLAVTWNGTPEQVNDYIGKVENLGYKVRPYDPSLEKKEGMAEERFLLLCLGVAGFAMGNLMLLSIGLWTTSQQDMGIETRDFMHWVSALIALPTIVFSGRPFFRSAIRVLRKGQTNMDVPISVALILTCVISLFETITHGEHAYFDSVVMLTFFLLIGRYLDFRARREARGTAGNLLLSLSGFAHVVEGHGRIRSVPVSQLKAGMTVRVMAGEKIPADGVIEHGKTTIDTALITGETMARDAAAGSMVYAGTINIAAPIDVRVVNASENTFLSDIVRLMEKAEQAQARYVRLADRVARLYTPVIHILAALSFIGWVMVGQAWQDSLLTAATVLIITCPCALALAVPVVQVLAIGRLMKNGVLIKSGDALERLAAVDTVLLDKTGTLTLGAPTLDQRALPDQDSLVLAASLASYSSHPLSRALCQYYPGPYLTLADVREHPGEGMEAMFLGRRVRLGRRFWCGGLAFETGTAHMEMWLALEGAMPQRFCFEDSLRDDAIETLSALKDRGLDLILVSGDREAVVREMAAQAGIARCHAEKTPVDKYQIMTALKEEGRNILMVGDGLNDAPVLAGADVSMSPAEASHLAQNASDVVFLGRGLMPLVLTYDVARLSQKLVKQNFALTVLYNIFAIPLAMAGYVTPLIAALAMSGSSLAVIANSFRLHRRSQ